MKLPEACWPCVLAVAGMLARLMYWPQTPYPEDRQPERFAGPEESRCLAEKLLQGRLDL